MTTKLNVAQATILIVDDHPGNVLLLSKILKADGFARILETTDPREVEAIYLRESPDIVLLDLNMPHMDGSRSWHGCER
jgi:CheY-like chemotaxis protein